LLDSVDTKSLKAHREKLRSGEASLQRISPKLGEALIETVVDEPRKAPALDPAATLYVKEVHAGSIEAILIPARAAAWRE
jgi:hypothetical protein